MTEIILPEYWNCDDSHILARLNAEGTAINLDDAVKRYAGELDFSPKIVDSRFVMYLGGVYVPERLCSLQAVQAHGHGKQHTTLTLTGMKESCIENAVKFAEACGFEAEGKPEPRKEKEMQLRFFYDKVSRIFGKEKSLEYVADSLRDVIADVRNMGMPHQGLN